MRLILFIIFLIGIGLLLYSRTLPAYSDMAEKAKWDQASCAKIDEKDWPQFSEQYLAAVAKLRTHKYDLYDLGLGLLSFAVVSLLISVFAKIKTFQDVKQIRSRRRSDLFALLNLACLAVIPALFLYYDRTGSRGDYPWFADSVMIAIVGGAAGVLSLLPIFNLILAGFLFRSQHPAPLFRRFQKYGLFAILVEMYMFFLLLLVGWAFVVAIIKGDILGVPICITLLYVVLSLRAGKVNGTR